MFVCLFSFQKPRILSWSPYYYSSCSHLEFKQAYTLIHISLWTSDNLLSLVLTFSSCRWYSTAYYDLSLFPLYVLIIVSKLKNPWKSNYSLLTVNRERHKTKMEKEAPEEAENQEILVNLQAMDSWKLISLGPKENRPLCLSSPGSLLLGLPRRQIATIVFVLLRLLR